MSGEGSEQREMEPIGEGDCCLCVHLKAAEEMSLDREAFARMIGLEKT